MKTVWLMGLVISYLGMAFEYRNADSSLATAMILFAVAMVFLFT